MKMSFHGGKIIDFWLYCVPKGFEVGMEKIDIIKNLPYPKNVREVRLFLGHVGFYERFIKDLSKVTVPMCQFLQKDVEFEFTQSLKEAFYHLKDLLTSFPSSNHIDYMMQAARLLEWCWAKKWIERIMSSIMKPKL